MRRRPMDVAPQKKTTRTPMKRSKQRPLRRKATKTMPVSLLSSFPFFLIDENERLTFVRMQRLHLFVAITPKIKPMMRSGQLYHTRMQA